MIVIAALLEKRDIFLRGNLKCRVMKVDKRFVYYSTDVLLRNGKRRGNYHNYKLGLKSKEKLILIWDKDFGNPENLKLMFTNHSQ